MNHIKKLLILLLAAFSLHAAHGARHDVRHVVLIGLDGWGAYSLPKADMPTVKALMQKGCSTLHKRSVMPSSSAPNWAAMFIPNRSLDRQCA